MTDSNTRELGVLLRRATREQWIASLPQRLQDLIREADRLRAESRTVAREIRRLRRAYERKGIIIDGWENSGHD